MCSRSRPPADGTDTNDGAGGNGGDGADGCTTSPRTVASLLEAVRAQQQELQHALRLLDPEQAAEKAGAGVLAAGKGGMGGGTGVAKAAAEAGALLPLLRAARKAVSLALALIPSSAEQDEALLAGDTQPAMAADTEAAAPAAWAAGPTANQQQALYLRINERACLEELRSVLDADIGSITQHAADISG